VSDVSNWCVFCYYLPSVQDVWRSLSGTSKPA